MKQKVNLIRKGLMVLLTAIMIVGCMPSLTTYAGTFLEAEALTVGTQATGSFSYGEKEAWYSFTTGEEAYYYVSASNPSVSKSCTFSLRENASKSITAVTVSAGMQKDTAMKKLKANSTYYIKVSGTPSKTEDVQYAFTLNAILDDAGNTPETALPIATNTVVKGSHEASGDVDFYSFTTGIEGVYTLEFKNSTSRNKSISICDASDKKSFGGVTATAGTTKQCESKMLEANTTYYIRVSQGEVGAYEFRIICPTDDCGNKAEQAGELTLGEKTSGLIDYKKDVDYWTFTTGEETDYKITVENSSNAALTVRFFDAAKIKQRFHYTGISKNSKKETYLSLKPSTKYYLEVSANYRYDNLAYAIKVEKVADDYKDEWTGAKAIELNKIYNGKVANTADNDWFKFTPSKEGKYEFSYNKSTGVRFDIYTLDKDGNIKNISRLNKKKTLTLNSKETYYIRLYTKTAWKAYDYGFKVIKK